MPPSSSSSKSKSSADDDQQPQSTPEQPQPEPSMSQYLHSTLRGLVELPTLPHNNDNGGGSNVATGPTVEERIDICDALGRYAAGDFSHNETNENNSSKIMGMMSHGAVDGYLDLHPGGGNAHHPAGGIVLPPLDWNTSFRKGYSVQMWVRPHLCRTSGPDGECCCHKDNASGDGSSGGDDNSNSLPDGPASAAAAAAAEAQRQAEADRPRVLYRFATSPENESGVGVCALLGKWTAHERPVSGGGDHADGDADGGGEGGADGQEDNGAARNSSSSSSKDITHLQTTLTVYTLPHHKSNPVFFVPSSRSGGGFKKSGGDGGNGGAAGWDSPGKSPRKRADGRGGGGGSFDDDDDGFHNSYSGGGGDGNDNLHEANMQRFEQQQQQQLHRTQDAASLATATLVLPSDEWSLVGINHVMPYLKRPQISICVNGDQVMKAELGYPQLDPAHMPPSAAASAAAASSSGGNDLATPQGSGGGGGTSGGGQGRASPSLGFRAGGAGGMTQVLKQAEELPPGWMGHCTVLDNTFGFDGVRIKGTKATYMPYHMHVAGLSLYSEPISSTVQAIVAEFGPNTPPGMVMPPVPCVVQNRDSVVTDGHHSGHSSGSSGRGGSGGGIAVGRGHKSGRSIGLATSIGVLPPSGHGRESLRVNIDGGGELHLQKAVGKCVLGWSFADAVSLGNDKVPSSTPSSSSGSLSSKAGSHGSGPVGPGRLICPPSRYNSSIGKADDVPKVGLVQPRPPPSADERSPHGLLGDKGGILGLGIVSAKTGLDVDFPGTGDRRYDGGGVLRTLGTSALWNTMHSFVDSEQKRTAAQSNMVVPIAPTLPSPTSYHMMYTSCDPMSYFLLPLRLALPPPGHVHNLQGKLYRESFWHLQALLATSNGVKGAEGALLAAIIRNVASSLRLGGRCRDDVLQSGAIYTLSTLVRRVLLRGYKLGLLDADHERAEKKISQAVMAGDGSADDDAGGNAKLQEYDDALHGIADDECRPPKIPSLVAAASVDLVDACCGPIWLDWHGQGIASSGKSGSSKSSSKRGSGSSSSSISPRRKMEKRSSDRDLVLKNAVIPASLHVRRSSDISQSALFGFALDFDLWGSDPSAAAKVLKAVALRFCSNGPSVDFASTIVEAPTDGKGGYGWLLRNQMSVQTFLDAIRLGFSDCTFLDEPMVSTANSLSAILKSMLDHSLSSHRSISRGEHDVAACVHALTDAPFGSITAHVVLASIADMLADSGAIRDYKTRETKEGKKHRLELTSRLGRNLLMSSFHDAVAPMLLGRTVFRGGETPDRESEPLPGDGESASNNLNWTHHWRLCLLIFSWISSVAGPEGEVAAKTTGAILDASSSAGSLAGALVVRPDDDGEEKQRAFIESLCFPPLPPASLSSTGSSSGHNESSGMDDYLKDLSHRLRCLLYLLPGLVQSLTAGVSPGQSIDPTSANVISTLLTSISVSFKQIGLESSNVRVDERLTPKAAQLALKAASQAIPPLIKLCTLLETPINELQGNASLPTEPRLRTDSADTNTTGAGGSVVLVSHSDASLQLPEKHDGEDSLTKLLSCQEALLDQSAGLLIDAMLAGAPAATKVLSLVIDAARSGSTDSAYEATEPTNIAAKSTNLLCRIASIVLLKIVKANKGTSSPWSNSALCGSVARVIDLVEEKNLLKVTAQEIQADQKFTSDQIRLLCSLVQILSQGRRSSGWMQINISPGKDKPRDDIGGDDKQEESLADRITRYIDESLIQNEYQLHMEDWHDDDDGDGPAQDNGLASILLLPILQPCLRATLEAASIVSATDSIYTNPSRRGSLTADNTRETNSSDNLSPTGPTKLSVLSALIHEIDSTLDAAIAGLAFPSARDQFLAGTSSLRKAIATHKDVDDNKSADLCMAVLVSAVRSLQKRYSVSNGEEGEEPSVADASSAAVENLMLGDALLGMSHDKYQRFAGAISRAATKEDGDDVLDILAPYLDEWDKALTAEEEESELVEQFNTSTLEEGQRAVVANSETSADALDTYASLSNNESSRLAETKLIMTSSRSKRLAFSDRNVFRSWLEILTDQGQWERCQSDGGRDYGSRIATVPIAPQFKRYVPPWLDHTITTNIEADGRAVEAKEDDDQDKDYEFISASKALEGVAIRDVTKEGMAEPKIGGDEDDELESDHHGEAIVPTLSRDEHHREDSNDDLSHSSAAGDGLDVGFPSKDDPKERDDEDQASGIETASTMDSATMESTSDVATLATTTSEVDNDKKLHKHHHRRTQGASTSSFSNPPDGSQAILGSVIYNGESGISQVVEHFYQGCLHVQQAGSRKATLLITSSHLILEYEEAGLFEEEAGHLQESRKRHLEEDDQGTSASSTPFMQKTDGSVVSAVDTTGEDGEHGIVHTEKSNPLYHAVEKHDITQDDKATQFEKIERNSTSSAQMRPKTMRWNISELSHIYLRRYRLRDSALEMFLIPTAGELYGSVGLYSSLTSIFIDFGPGYEGNLKRDDAANAIMRRAPAQTIKQWPERSGQFLHEQLRQVTRSWITRRLSNFEYILSLNILAGRSFNDISQYPVFPWVLGGSSYSQEELPDLEDPASYRDLSKPMGALNPTRLKEFKDRFESFQDAGVEIPPFMYGSHYSTAAGVVCYFLLRLHPFSQLHRQLQSGHFDVADRLFASVPRTWDMNTGPSAAEVKELTPEWYCNPAFLKNTNNYKLGSTQDGEEVGDVTLPPWAKGSPEKFVEVMRLALESDICSEGLPDWIDLIFGRKQQGPEAIEADNVFFYLTYYGSVDLQAVDDEVRQSLEDQILHFGSCPMQLFWRPHVKRLPRSSLRTRAFENYVIKESQIIGESIMNAEALQNMTNAAASPASSNETFLNALSTLRSALYAHEGNNDTHAAAQCRSLIILLVQKRASLLRRS